MGTIWPRGTVVGMDSPKGKMRDSVSAMGIQLCRWRSMVCESGESNFLGEHSRGRFVVVFALYNPGVVITVNSGTSRVINKIRWGKKEGQHVAHGECNSRLYIYDLEDMGVAQCESEWIISEARRTVVGL